MTAPKSTIVLVTGANQGIGYEIAKKLGKDHEGYHVLVAGRRKEAVEEAAKKLQAEGCSVEPLVLDVTSDESIAEAAKTVDAKYGRLDVLINNAAISGGAEPLSRKLFLDILNTNVVGVELVTDAFIPLLEKTKTEAKRVVFVGSSMGSLSLKADPQNPMHKMDYRAYTISKAAENMLALHYASKYEDDKTWRFDISCPGYCGTNLNAYAGSNPPETGAVNAVRLATTLGTEGETGTFSNTEGPIPW